ncbi:hypothetical protein [Evansella tamaricis]|uniref:Uncharacterized protein n=1 Tax=Evansella tamaricis TaxID=2069301 RepID=A0ABS6JHT4_9BACI|nr:hypothetical protein [Evansella tamaricis]MBU9713088.1 hypothetical protein [Evansella tamaricis]
MTDDTTKLLVQTQLGNFMESMLLRRNINADRTWYYAMDRFFQYLSTSQSENYSDYNEESINDYINQLSSNNQSAASIKKFVDILLLFSEFIEKNVEKEKLKIPKVFLDEVPHVENESDLIHTENVLFLKVKEFSEELDLQTEVTSLEDSSQLPYDKLRDSWRNYLLFRLLAETNLDGEDVIHLNLKDYQGGTLNVGKKEVLLSENLASILQEYCNYREKYDAFIYSRRMMNEINFAGKGINELLSDKEMREFLNLGLQEKLERIESLLSEQLGIEDKIQQIELNGEETEEEIVEDLEEEADAIARKITEWKKIMVFERKRGDYGFNEAMFVTDSYLRMTPSALQEVMVRESFPVETLKNTEIIKSGFHFKDRNFF